MAREQRGNRKPASGADSHPDAAASADALNDALAATQQHTVPLLPSFEGDAPDLPTRLTRAPSRQTTQTTYARRTLAPRVTTGQSSGALDTSSTRQPARADLSTGGLARRSSSPAHAGEDAIRADENSRQATGRSTIGLPAITDAQLPAVASTRREVAVARGDEPAALLIRGAKKPRAHTRMPVVPRRIKPRSFASQFIISMVSVMALFTALTIASPLARTSAFANTFQAYGNAVPWIPTATPTPKPTPTPVPYQPPVGANPGQQAIINEIVAVFGSYSQGALNIARCESGYDPNAVNPYAIGNSHASGVFQILYPSTWDGTSYAAQSPFDYNANIHAAYEIFSRDGYSWREWECKPY